MQIQEYKTVIDGLLVEAYTDSDGNKYTWITKGWRFEAQFETLKNTGKLWDTSDGNSRDIPQDTIDSIEFFLWEIDFVDTVRA